MDLLSETAPFAALLLLAAVAGGFAAASLRIPRVVGYLCAGLALRLLLGRLCADRPAGDVGPLLEQLTGPVQGIKTLALGLVLFSLGRVFEFQHLRSVGRRILRISSGETLAVIVLVAAGCTMAWLLAGGHGGPRDGLVAGLLLGIIGLATAPAATVLVVQEYDARGPVADSVLTLTAINNVACIVLFHVAFVLLTAGGWITSGLSGQRLVWLDLLLISGGSLVLGLALGLVFSVLHARLARAEFVLVFLAALLSFGTYSEWLSGHFYLSFNYLLVCLFAGAAFANSAVDAEPLHELLGVLGKPIYACFFVLAGYELHVEELRSIGWIGVAYVVLRIAGKLVGPWLAVRSSRTPELRPSLGAGLLCQAGVAIGLVDFLARTWGTQSEAGFVPSPVALQLKTIILGSIVVYELTGPLALKALLIRSGEVKAITLIAGARDGSASGFRLALDALLRVLWPGRVRRVAGRRPLTVRDLMRTSVRFIPAPARLDEVLHYVERSREHQFPVVGPGGEFVGMIHFADLRNILYNPVLRDLITAHDLARPDDIAVPLDMPLAELFAAFERADVSALPVVETPGSRRVVGVVEQRDLLKLLHEQVKTTG